MIKIDDLPNHVERAYKNKVATLIWGPPGIGKSQSVKAIAQKLGLELIDLRLPQLEPTDLRGIPAPNRETMAADWFYPSFLPKDGKGLIFLDEIEKASVAVKNAALQLVLDRRIGDYELPDGWGVIAAANREEDGCFSGQIGTALGNRFLHFEVAADLDVWLKWAYKNDIDTEIMAFLQFQPTRLHKMDAGSHAFPSPRSWEFLSTMLKGVESEVERGQLFEAAVGAVVGGEYRVWNKLYRNIDVEAIIVKGELPPTKTKKDREQLEEPSFKYALSLAVAHYVIKHFEKIKKYAKNVNQFVEILEPEQRLIFAKQFKSAQIGELFDSKAVNDKHMKDLIDVIVSS